MTATTDRATVRSQSPPSTPRVNLVPTRARQAVLDGAWWPRSTDPVAELPGLVLALNDRYGTVRQIMLNSETWTSRFRHLVVGSRTVRLGWFRSLDPALAIVTTDGGDQLDLLVVPPATAEAAALGAMAQAADPANTLRAPAILATISHAPARIPVTGIPRDADRGSVLDSEGGRAADRPAA